MGTLLWDRVRLLVYSACVGWLWGEGWGWMDFMFVAACVCEHEGLCEFWVCGLDGQIEL